MNTDDKLRELDIELAEEVLSYIKGHYDVDDVFNVDEIFDCTSAYMDDFLTKYERDVVEWVQRYFSAEDIFDV